MVSPIIVSSTVASTDSEQPNVSLNECSHADVQPCRALTDPVTRCADLMALIRARQTVAHIAQLVRLRDAEIRTQQAIERRERDMDLRAPHIASKIDAVSTPTNGPCAKDCGSKICDMFGCMLDDRTPTAGGAA